MLFATDIAARGLDIPAVHWVVQVRRLREGTVRTTERDRDSERISERDRDSESESERQILRERESEKVRQTPSVRERKPDIVRHAVDQGARARKSE